MPYFKVPLKGSRAGSGRVQGVHQHLENHVGQISSFTWSISIISAGRRGPLGLSQNRFRDVSWESLKSIDIIDSCPQLDFFSLKLPLTIEVSKLLVFTVATSCHCRNQAAARQPDGAARRRSVNDSTTRRHSVNHEAGSDRLVAAAAKQTWTAIVVSCLCFLKLFWGKTWKNLRKGMVQAIKLSIVWVPKHEPMARVRSLQLKHPIRRW